MDADHDPITRFLRSPRRPNAAYGNACALTADQIEARFGCPAAALIALVERHTLSVQAWLPARAPQVARLDRPGVIAVSNGMPVRLFNQALGAGFDGLSDVAIGQTIGEVQQFFAARGVPWIWWLGPSTPTGLPAQLAAHGLHINWYLPAMAAPLDRVDALRAPSSVRVWQARDAADLRAASTIRRRAFRFAEGAGVSYFEDCAEDWLKGDPARLYLAAEGDDPAGALGAVIASDGLPGIYVMATLPELERRGLGAAVLIHMLRVAAQESRAVALTASTRGFGLYQKLGFEYLFDFALCEPAL